MNAKEFIRIIEKQFPPKYTLDFDHNGLQVGPFEKEIRKVLVTLDITQTVIEEAILQGCDFILSHHPLVFLPLYSVNASEVVGRMIIEAVKNSITLYSSHTPADIAWGGINDYWVNALSIENPSVLFPTFTEKILKIQVFVPKSYLEEVRNAMFLGGAGAIGNYSDCTFSTSGEGTFRPLSGSNPFIGKKDALEKAQEYKIESIIEESRLPQLLEEIRKVHPYEEIAYDILQENSIQNQQKTIGIGRYGRIKPQSFRDFIDTFKKITAVDSLKFSGNLEDSVTVIGICAGSGKRFIDAIPQQLDVFITGDVGYHDWMKVKEKGKKLILFEHRDSEKIFPKVVKNLLTQTGIDFVEFVDVAYDRR